MTIRASRKPASGLNAESSRFTVTNSIEPAKMNALIHIGHTKEKPLVPMRMPYEAPRNRNPRQIGMVSRFERRQPGVGVGVGGVCHVDDVLLVQLVCRPMFADDAICGYTRMVSINGVRVASGPCARSHSVEDVTSSTVG